MVSLLNLFYQSSDNQERSGPHRRVERILDSIGVAYMSEQPFPPYKVDILLPEVWAAIEVDGPFHSDKKDKARDEYLLVMFGVNILRLKMKRWMPSGKIKQHIIEFIEANSEDVSERKAKWLTAH